MSAEEMLLAGAVAGGDAAPPCADTAARAAGEVHHRAKNAMASVIALLELQASHVGDAATVAMLDELQQRVRTIAMAFEHLIGNAWKFTRMRPDARIEIGACEVSGQTVFHVRDNGVGFDMAAAGNLFAPFVRLHGAGEFDGHGIGLATVKRLVERHGGQVWAESQYGQGATFFFTLSGAPH